MSRTIAIGDIHGCSVALKSLIDAIEPQSDDLIVPLGDYVDRGIDSKGGSPPIDQAERSLSIGANFGESRRDDVARQRWSARLPVLVELRR